MRVRRVAANYQSEFRVSQFLLEFGGVESAPSDVTTVPGPAEDPSLEADGVLDVTVLPQSETLSVERVA